MNKWDGFDDNSVDNWLTIATGNYVMDELRNLIFVSIISADNDEFGLTEDQKQDIIQRHKMHMSWESVLEPIPNEGKRKKLIDFFEESELD